MQSWKELRCFLLLAPNFNKVYVKLWLLYAQDREAPMKRADGGMSHYQVDIAERELAQEDTKDGILRNWDLMAGSSPVTFLYKLNVEQNAFKAWRTQSAKLWTQLKSRKCHSCRFPLPPVRLDASLKPGLRRAPCRCSQGRLHLQQKPAQQRKAF